VLFRVVLGLAVGAAALIVPLYLSEIAPTEIRGAISSLNQLMIVVGILSAFVVNALLAEAPTIFEHLTPAAAGFFESVLRHLDRFGVPARHGGERRPRAPRRPMPAPPPPLASFAPGFLHVHRRPLSPSAPTLPAPCPHGNRNPRPW